MAVKPNIEVAKKHTMQAYDLIDRKIFPGMDVNNRASDHLQAARAALKGPEKMHLEYYKALVRLLDIPDGSTSWEESLNQDDTSNT